MVSVKVSSHINFSGRRFNKITMKRLWRGLVLAGSIMLPIALLTRAVIVMAHPFSAGETISGITSQTQIERLDKAILSAALLWQQHGLANYDIDVESAGAWCSRTITTLHVRNNHIASTSGNGVEGFCFSMSPDSVIPPRIYDWIRQINHIKNDCLDILQVSFDPYYGYPARVAVDSMHCSDTDAYYDYSNFQLINP